MKKIVMSAACAATLLATACGGDAPTTLAPVTSPVRFVVRHGDYTSTALSLLDASGGVVVDGWFHSGSRPPGLTAVLSGDVDVPSLMEPGVITVIDRYGVDVVTRVDLATGNVLGQVRTQGASDSAFSSNPTDVAYVSPTSAWVSRYSHNLMADVADDVRGSDILEIDPSTMTLTGQRVDLSPLSVDVPVLHTDGPATMEPARVRPSRIVRVGGFLAIGLDLITDGFESAAPGQLAIVDLATHALTSFSLGALTNCGAVHAVPGEPTHVAVACKGYSDPIAEGGVVVVAIDPVTGVATEVDSYLMADHVDEATVFDDVLMLADDEFLGIHLGGYDPSMDPPDSLVHVDIADGTRSTVLTSGGASDLFVTMAFDPATGLILVPDQSTGIRRMRRAVDGTITQTDVVHPSGRGLPARAVSLLP